MSNAIRYDALLLRALAAELEDRLRGARIARAWFDKSARVLALELGEKRRLQTFSWNLHPAAGHVALRPGVPGARGAQLQVRAGTPLVAVHTLPDERVLRFELAPDGVVRTLVVELLGNRWNALALTEGDVISAALLQRDDPVRPLRAGVVWLPPGGVTRQLPDADAWVAALQPAADRTRAALSSFAYLSPLNVAYVLGDAAHAEAGEHVLRAAHARYRSLLEAAAQPCVLPGGQPYVHPLGLDVLPVPTLLDAFARAAEHAALPALGADALREQVRAALYEREQRLHTRARRLAREARDGAAEAAQLRGWADVLLAQLHLVPRGAGEVTLTDFAGEAVHIPLDATKNAAQNAQALYEQARRRERAAARIPRLLEQVSAELTSLRAVRVDELPPEELASWAARAAEPAQAASLPYRRYRTSGGLEVRVGRSAKANDALITSAHSSPDDVWLHARDVGGAHVILRWARKDANPPHADLVEAAVLAALYSRARTSGTVPVDWTRRKYVRKPRKAPPGLVVPERVSTVFVAPDAAVEERMRE